MHALSYLSLPHRTYDLLEGRRRHTQSSLGSSRAFWPLGAGFPCQLGYHRRCPHPTHGLAEPSIRRRSLAMHPSARSRFARVPAHAAHAGISL